MSNEFLWVEKYRPTKLVDYVGNEHLKSKVEGYLESGDVPHLLLYGKAGTGKTTLAKLIVNFMKQALQKCLVKLLKFHRMKKPLFIQEVLMQLLSYMHIGSQ